MYYSKYININFRRPVTGGVGRCDCPIGPLKDLPHHTFKKKTGYGPESVINPVNPVAYK